MKSALTKSDTKKQYKYEIMTSNNNNKITNPNHTFAFNNSQQIKSHLEEIVQWNINRYLKKLPNVYPTIADFQPLALCLEESNLKNHKNNLTLKNYQGYFKNRIIQGRASGGLCMFASSASKIEIIPLNTPLEAIAIKITSN